MHPLVNYAFHPAWDRDWERGLQAADGVRVTAGSVSTDDLYTDLTVNVTEPLNRRFRFLYRGVWRDGLHLDRERDEHWVGFECGVLPRLAVHLQVQPAPDKEEFDLAAGFLLHDAARERFLRLGVRWDDFLYERKNPVGGVSVQEPVSVQWEARYAAGGWEIFSAGRYGSPSERLVPAEGTPAGIRTFERDGEATVRLRRVWSEDDFAGLEATHYRFEARRAGRDDYAYDDAWVHVKGYGVFGIGGRWGLRPEFHWLRQWSRAAGPRTFDHRREDLFPALSVELRAPGRSVWELGYLAVHHAWTYRTGSGTDDRTGYTDKIKLGWTYRFGPRTRVQFSLSHEPDPARFGGGHAMFQTVF